MIYGYIRVSSDKQTVENQRFEINGFCEKEKLIINDWIEETISGTKSYNKRQLGHLLAKVCKDDIIICSELSRLGRNLFMIMEILNICMTKECRVWTIKDNYRLGEDIQSKVLAFAFGLSAEIEPITKASATLKICSSLSFPNEYFSCILSIQSSLSRIVIVFSSMEAECRFTVLRRVIMRLLLSVSSISSNPMI